MERKELETRLENGECLLCYIYPYLHRVSVLQNTPAHMSG